MTSDKQVRANKANATKSTGPRTEVGRARSSANALKHGLTAERAVIPGEDAAEYAAFQEGLRDQLGLEGVLEAFLVERLASTLWRLRRVPYLETAFFAYSQHKRSRNLGLDTLLELPGVAADLHDRTWTLQSEDRETLNAVGRIVEDALSANVLPKLSSYEAKLFRQAEKLLRELNQLRERRNGFSLARAAEAPALDADPGALVIDAAALGSWAASLPASERAMDDREPEQAMQTSDMSAEE